MVTAAAAKTVHASVLAPAKINLFLHVCGKRSDGYHLLDSLVVFTTLGDVVEAAPALSISLAITGPFANGLSAGEDNLVVRAARLLARTAGEQRGAALSLQKRLPVASGIGGGSSDAAAALRACAQLWDVNVALPPQELAALGADIPVCVARQPCRMQGIGEILAPAPALPPAWLVLVNPGNPLATGPVFTSLGGRHSGPAPAMPPRFDTAAALAAFLAGTRNDLAAPARELLPEIADVMAAIEGCDGCLLARLSGSGPTCFGLFAEEARAAAAARKIGQAQAGWWAVTTSLLRNSG